MNKFDRLQSYLNEQGIFVEKTDVKPSFYDPQRQAGNAISGFSHATVAENHVNLTVLSAEAMSLASMAAVLILDANEGHRVLDTCAAPGMKGLYLNSIQPGLLYFANDISAPRLGRLKRLFEKHTIHPQDVTKHDAAHLDELYEENSFDRIIIDAPCSGEGVILGGDEKLLAAWSPAKVKRLQQIQIKLLKNAWRLLAPGGRLVYATCTLNKNENERVIKKALKIPVTVNETALYPNSIPHLDHAHAWRIIPSRYSIGFFIAVLEKNGEIEYN